MNKKHLRKTDNQVKSISLQLLQNQYPCRYGNVAKILEAQHSEGQQTNIPSESAGPDLTLCS